MSDPPAQSSTSGGASPKMQTQEVPGDTPASATEPVFPLLQNNRAASPLSSDRAGGIDDEPAVVEPFVRTSSPDSAPRAPASAADNDGANSDRAPDRLVYNMHKFSLYETASRYYIVGVDVSENHYRILKIDRTTEGAELNVTDDKIIYSLKEMNQLLDTIDDGNRGTGGIKLRCTTWGLLGFIKFTGPYYMLLITKKSTVAMVGGHYIYQIEGTELVPLVPGRVKPDTRNTEEQRFLGILNNLDLTKSFYYSYSYDVTRTLQHNITRERTALGMGKLPLAEDDFNSMFVWNAYLLQPAIKALNDPYDWCRPIIHGYIDQAGEFCIFSLDMFFLAAYCMCATKLLSDIVLTRKALSIYGRTAHITVIARRSRYFAGARFLKRGANDLVSTVIVVNRPICVAKSLRTGLRSQRRRDGANCRRVPDNLVPCPWPKTILQPPLHILRAASREHPPVLDAG